MIGIGRIFKKLECLLDRKQKKFVLIIIIMMLIGGVVESASVSLMFPLIETVMNKGTWGESFYIQIISNLLGTTSQKECASVLIICLIFLFLMKNAYLLWEYYVQNTFVSNCKYKIQKDLLHKYLHKPYVFFLQASSGEIVRIINEDSISAFNALSSALSFCTELIVSVILAITIIVLSPQMAIGMICVLLVEVTAIMGILKPRLKAFGDKGRAETAVANKWMLQSISGIKSIKVAANEKYFEENFNRHNRVAVKTLKNYSVMSNIPRLGIEAFTMSGVLFVMLLMINAGTEITDLVPSLSAFALAAVRLLPSANRISQSYSYVIYSEGAVDSIISVTRLEEERKDSGRDGTECDVTFHDSVHMKDITFSYPNAGEKIFDKASFGLRLGESIGIIGASGAGKTTLVDILLGLLKPQNGCVMADSVDIEKNMAGWFSHVAYIPQSIFLLDDTIRENIKFGSEKDADELVWLALKDAQLEEFVRALPSGLNTTIGEAGIRLSGGQRQRIGIARALYNNPDILIFDEATSALDNETEAAIMESIDNLKGKKTLIIIAHRLTTIQKCDIVYRVGNGGVKLERQDVG